MLRLRHQQTKKLIQIEKELIVGRNKTDLNDTDLSREHFTVILGKSAYYVADLKSKNKTRLNGTVLSPQIAQRLRMGDEIKAGSQIWQVYSIDIPDYAKDLDNNVSLPETDQQKRLRIGALVTIIVLVIYIVLF